ncbi:hypothetical protein [Sphingomonas sp.]|uniref:hypothetical protein n=1 Tax=Sphingomonas sp. TaxID=28214 RepID=UPI002E347F57|nr:hypothetical protein [Sphingomonas sp.]HEX4695001.1 hypothetical protein [Sphingomonas sp.]
MTIGELKRAIADLDDGLDIVLAVPLEDPDGDDVERVFALVSVETRVDPDTAESYAHFAGGDW